MSFSDAVYGAVRTPHPDDARSAVHEVVGRELRRLDPGVSVHPTEYFNHTFVPDFVLGWPRGEETITRDLYLRLSVSSPAFGEDLDLLADRAPLFIGVFDDKPMSSAPWAEAAATMQSLVTQARAVDHFDEELERESRTGSATREIVRRGRGAIEPDHAEKIGSSYRRALNTIDRLKEEPSDDQAIETVREALEMIGPVLLEEGDIEIEQTLHALWIRNGGSPSEFPGQQGWNPATLSPEGLRAVLLDLVEGGGVGIDPPVWVDLAGHIPAEEVGRFLGRPLYDGGFDHMATALSPNWTAKWVWIDEQQTGSLIPEPYAWLIDDKILGIDAGNIRMFFADDGRHFIGKARDYSLPSLTDAVQFLEDPAVQGVSLRSPRDDVELVLREGAAGKSVQEIVTDLLTDPAGSGHRLKSMFVAVPDKDASARVDFQERKIDFLGESTDIRIAARMAYRFFAEPDGEASERFDAFLNQG